MGLYLAGTWISSIPFDEEAGANIGLDFMPRAPASSASPTAPAGTRVPYQTISDWEFELHDTYDLAVTQDGFTVTIDGVPEAYRVDVQSFAAARLSSRAGTRISCITGPRISAAACARR